MKKSMAIPMKQIKINSSLSRRFIVSFIMAVIAILLVTVIAAIAYSAKSYDADMKTRLDNTIQMANASIAFSLWNVQKDVVNAQTDALFREKGIAFIEILDEGNSMAKLPGTRDFSFYEEKNPGDVYLCKVSDIIYAGVKVGSIRVAIDKREFQPELLLTIIIIIGVTMTIIIAITITSIVITKRHIFRPLSKLETSAGLIAEGNLDTVIDTVSEDEIGKLAKSFDGMRKSIKELIEKLKKAKEEAEKVNQTLNLFIANMSHEIRTPMHVILSYTDLLERRLTGEEERKYLTVINSNSNMLLQLLNGILDLSKIKVGRLELISEPMDIRAALADIKRSFLLKIEEKNLDFNINVDPAFPPVIYFDATRLKQIVFNMVGNAVKFTDSGYVTLDVKIRSSRGADSTIDFSITVEDTGRGIDRAKLEKIFDYFVQSIGSGKSFVFWGNASDGQGGRFLKKLPREASGPPCKNF
jgi:signal transduction histidine kinase